VRYTFACVNKLPFVRFWSYFISCASFVFPFLSSSSYGYLVSTNGYCLVVVRGLFPVFPLQLSGRFFVFYLFLFTRQHITSMTVLLMDCSCLGLALFRAVRVLTQQLLLCLSLHFLCLSLFSASPLQLREESITLILSYTRGQASLAKDKENQTQRNRTQIKLNTGTYNPYNTTRHGTCETHRQCVQDGGRRKDEKEGWQNQTQNQTTGQD
jgi:hypothetical protein